MGRHLGEEEMNDRSGAADTGNCLLPFVIIIGGVVGGLFGFGALLSHFV